MSLHVHIISLSWLVDIHMNITRVHAWRYDFICTMNIGLHNKHLLERSPTPNCFCLHSGGTLLRIKLSDFSASVRGPSWTVAPPALRQADGARGAPWRASGERPAILASKSCRTWVSTCGPVGSAKAKGGLRSLQWSNFLLPKFCIKVCFNIFQPVQFLHILVNTNNLGVFSVDLDHRAAYWAPIPAKDLEIVHQQWFLPLNKKNKWDYRQRDGPLLLVLCKCTTPGPLHPTRSTRARPQQCNHGTPLDSNLWRQACIWCSWRVTSGKTMP